MSASARAMLDTAVSEAAFQAAVIDMAKLYGWHVAVTWDSRHSPFGEPDLRLMRPPRYVLLELKKQDGQPTEHQYFYLEAASRCPGIEAWLVKPSDWEEIERFLR